MPGTAEFDKACSELRLPSMSDCVAISVLKPWRADHKAFAARKEAFDNKTSLLLFYKSASNVDIHGERTSVFFSVCGLCVCVC